MECNYNIRTAKKAGKKVYYFQASDTLRPYHWTRLKAFCERNGGKYQKVKYAFKFDQDPRPLISEYIERYCDSFIPKEEPFTYMVKTKTNLNGPTNYLKKVAKKVRNSQLPKGEKKRKAGRPKIQPNEKDLLKKKLDQQDAEIAKLKAEGAKLEEANRVTREKEQTRKKALQEKEKNDLILEINAVKIKIYGTSNLKELDEIGSSWPDNEEIESSINTRRLVINEENEKAKAEKAKKQLIHVLAANNGRAMSYELLRAHGIEPTGEDMVVLGINLIRRYHFFSYIISVPEDFHY